MAPLEDAEEGEVNIEEDSDDVEPLRSAPSPKLPSADEVECHRCTHIPFRSWCKWCILGRGRGAQHRGAQESTIACVGVDYFFITSGGLFRRDELDYPRDVEGEQAVDEARRSGQIIKCIIVRCSQTKCLFAHAVPYKGAGEDDLVANIVAEDILWLGHVELIVKADNEPALQALVTRVLEVVRVKGALSKVTREEPAKYDSQSNGGTEVGVRLVRGLFRTLKLCLEARVDRYIPVDHALIPWLLQHTCLLLNTKTRGPDGLTPWARARGRPFGQRVIGFAECILYKLPVKGPASRPDGNMGRLGGEGVCLGYNRTSNTYIVATETGITASRSLARRPEAHRWSPEALARIKIRPWSQHDRPQPEVRFQPAVDEPVAPPETAAPTIAKRLRINQKELDDYGYTEGCPQCAHAQRYGRARPGGQHSAACRARIVEAMSQSDVGKRRIEAHEERVNRSIAEQIEHADKQRTTASAPAAVDASPASRPLHDEGREVLGREPQQHGAPAQPVLTPERARASAEDAERRPRGVEDHWPHVPGGEVGYDSPTAPSIPASADQDAEMDNDQDDQGDTVMSFIGSLEPDVDDVVSDMLLQQLGSTGRSHRRETRRACRRIVSEVFSPPRVTALLKETRHRHLVPGFALDLTVIDPDDGQAWDFNDPLKREKARRMIHRQKPYLLIGSPECTAFSTWQALNIARSARPEQLRRQKIASTVHLKFMTELYQDQVEAGRYFLHEHPAFATSWQEEMVRDLLAVPSVERVQADQCQYGAEAQRGRFRGMPIMKPTGFMTNSPRILQALSRRCTGAGGECSRRRGGRHTLCSGSVAKDAAKYPRELCRAIIKGATQQLRDDGMLKNGCFGIQVPDDEEEIASNVLGPEQGYSGRYKDDLTGQVLRDDWVKEARAKELLYFHSKGVWRKVPRHEARARTGRPPISVRWVDVNKGDEQSPNYRSRLVARQLKALDKTGQSFFAPAPPLEALRTVLSLAMTRIGDHQPCWDPTSTHRTQLSFIDIKRAYFNAKIDPRAEPTFVELPPEDEQHGEFCAELLRHMYGTRMAADGWQEEYSTLMVRLGFNQGVSCPNVFYHEKRHITCSVHGDDFTSSGPATSLDWFEQAVSAEYETSIGPRLGPGKHDEKEGRALNRVIRWCSGHIEYEADPRQAEKLIAECGLTGAKAVATPGVKATFHELEQDTDLPQRLHTAFRGAAARGNYLAADRIDGQYACKEVCRWMSKPTAHSWHALKRLCRFLSGTPRLVYQYPQQSVDSVDVYTDTDWAGCPRTRKSTSGGCVMLGRHAIKHWSSTQSSISLSSGEAEFAGVIRGAGQGLGYQALLRDFGVTAPVRVWTDSSAAIGICSRQGLGKLRHLDTHTLWIQQAVRTGRIDLRKILGEENPADLLTKHSLSRQRMEKLVDLHGCRYMGGRAETAPLMREGASTRATMASESRDLAAVEPEPRMPHNELGRDELDAAFPPMTAPENDLLDDLADDDNDAVYQKGLAIAKEITENMKAHGRRRHAMSPITSTSKDHREHDRVTRDTQSRHRGTPVTRHPVPKEEQGDPQVNSVTREFTDDHSTKAIAGSTPDRRRSDKFSGHRDHPSLAICAVKLYRNTAERQKSRVWRVPAKLA